MQNCQYLAVVPIQEILDVIWKISDHFSYSFSIDRGKAPAPRYDHIATVHAEQYLLIFGGSSQSTCFNDLHLLDLQTVHVISLTLLAYKISTLYRYYVLFGIG